MKFLSSERSRRRVVARCAGPIVVRREGDTLRLAPTGDSRCTVEISLKDGQAALGPRAFELNEPAEEEDDLRAVTHRDGLSFLKATGFEESKRVWWLLPLGFAMQGIAGIVDPDIGFYVVLTSYLPLLALMILKTLDASPPRGALHVHVDLEPGSTLLHVFSLDEDGGSPVFDSPEDDRSYLSVARTLAERLGGKLDLQRSPRADPVENDVAGTGYILSLPT